MAQRAGSVQEQGEYDQIKALDLKVGYISSELMMPSHDLAVSKHHERHSGRCSLHKAVPTAVKRRSIVQRISQHFIRRRIASIIRFLDGNTKPGHIMTLNPRGRHGCLGHIIEQACMRGFVCIFFEFSWPSRAHRSERSKPAG